MNRTEALLPCPFCGSTNIDPREWASVNRHGPGCSDCGATAESNAAWNHRAALSDTAEPGDDRRRAGYDLGAGKVREGDDAMFDGRKCKVLTVYHDGDVQIEVPTYPTVKWQQVTPLPPAPGESK